MNSLIPIWVIYFHIGILAFPLGTTVFLLFPVWYSINYANYEISCAQLSPKLSPGTNVIAKIDYDVINFQITNVDTCKEENFSQISLAGKKISC